MIFVLGYPLEQAQAMLHEQGYQTTSVQVSSRKGLQGDQKRVIRQTLISHDGQTPCVELAYSEFQIRCANDN